MWWAIIDDWFLGIYVDECSGLSFWSEKSYLELVAMMTGMNRSNV